MGDLFWSLVLLGAGLYFWVCYQLTEPDMRRYEYTPPKSVPPAPRKVEPPVTDEPALVLVQPLTPEEDNDG